MDDPALIHQLQAIDKACGRLQTLTADDAKAAGILLCIRSLLVKLILDRTLEARLVDEARARTFELSEQIAAVLGDASMAASVNDAPVMPALRDAVIRLQGTDDPAARALIARSLAIETQSLQAFEDAFAAADAAGAEPATQAAYDIKKLGEYLSAEVFAAPGLTVASIEVISGGYSKLTLRARLRGAPELPASVILRVDRPENQKFVGTKVADEFPLLVALHESGVCVPRTYAFESSGAVLGAPALVLGEVSGTTIGDLFNFPARSCELGVQLAQQLALIHAMPESITSPSLVSAGEDMVAAMRRDVESLRLGWQALGRASAIIEAAFHCLHTNLHLAVGRRTFIHGDFGLHNILVEQGRITAVLDWEFARLANPAVDLGWFYYTAEHLVGWQQFLADYADAGGVVPPHEQLNFYRLWGATRFAVLCCQVDAGFNAGVLGEIEYAVPGNRLYRIQAVRVANALKTFQSSAH